MREGPFAVLKVGWFFLYRPSVWGWARKVEETIAWSISYNTFPFGYPKCVDVLFWNPPIIYLSLQIEPYHKVWITFTILLWSILNRYSWAEVNESFDRVKQGVKRIFIKSHSLGSCRSKGEIGITIVYLQVSMYVKILLNLHSDGLHSVNPL